MPKLEFSDAHFQVVAEALGNMPLKLAMPVVQEINRQLLEQHANTKKQEPRND